jgi:hypothetical protein
MKTEKLLILKIFEIFSKEIRFILPYFIADENQIYRTGNEQNVVFSFRPPVFIRDIRLRGNKCNGSVVKRMSYL